MHAQWEALHTSLTRSIRTTHAIHVFEGLRRESSFLQPFTDPSHLVTELTTPAGDLDMKDSVIATLVSIVQRPRFPAESRLARALLSLGLWPGLDAYFRKRLRTSSTEADELAASITCAFAEAVQSLDVEGARRPAATRPAATLIANTQRRLGYVARKARRLDSLTRSLDELEARYSEDQHTCGVLAASTRAEEREPESFWATLRRDDLEIVVRIVLWGETPWQVAQHLGVTYDVARKRYNRALRRLRNLFSEACPKSEETTAFEGVSAAEDAGR